MKEKRERVPALQIHDPQPAAIPPAGTADTNPKRKRGSQVAASLALRVSVKRLIDGRWLYSYIIDETPAGVGPGDQKVRRRIVYFTLRTTTMTGSDVRMVPAASVPSTENTW